MSATSKPLQLGHRCTCTEHHALEAAATDFWNTPAGILRRIDSLAQNLYFNVVNGAFQLAAQQNGDVSWLFWQIADDDKVCWRCLEKATGGDGGWYRKNWFLPKIPVHLNCRCLWVLFVGER